DDPLLAGVALLAPADKHMVAFNGKVQLSDDAPQCSSRPSVDVLFRSLARSYAQRALAVVLSGMGRDGAEGAKAISSRGGRVIAQDEESSAIFGMPRSVIETGAADMVLPPDAIVTEILRFAREGGSDG
ncbi:CheB methylesterase domain-containing protein, partial [Planctomycetota bacterium]